MELGIAERVMLSSVLAPAEGDVTMLRVVRDLLARVGFDAEESKRLNFQQQGEGEAARTTWSEDADRSLEVEFSDAELGIIASLFKKLSRSGKMRVAMLDLHDKFVEKGE